MLRTSLRHPSRSQAGLSLIGVAIGAALLAIVVMAGLYSIRYERNAFVDAFDSLFGQKAMHDAAKKSKEATDQAKSAITGKAPPQKVAGELKKCEVNGQVTYTNLPCEGTSTKVKVHETAGVEAPKQPPKEEKAPMNATDRAIEKATR